MTKEQAVSDVMIEKVWADFVNCQDDRYFGNKTKRGHQLAVLRRFADSILTSHPLEQQQAVSGGVVERLDGCAKRARELGKNVAICLPSDVEQAVAALTASGMLRMRELLERWLRLADSGHFRDGAELSLAAHPVADDTRTALQEGD